MKLQFYFNLRTNNDSRFTGSKVLTLGTAYLIRIAFEEKEKINNGEIICPVYIEFLNVVPKTEVIDERKYLRPEWNQNSEHQAHNLAFHVSNLFQLHVGKGELVHSIGSKDTLKYIKDRPRYIYETPEEKEKFKEYLLTVGADLILCWRIEGANPLFGTNPVGIIELSFNEFWNNKNRQDLLTLYADAMRLKDQRSQFRELHRVLERANSVLDPSAPYTEGEKKWDALIDFFDSNGHPEWGRKVIAWRNLRHRCSHGEMRDYIRPGNRDDLNEILSEIPEIQAASRFAVEEMI
ncbi:hypothetical protein HY229_01665 [Candidatus Acetothermia bacterium]|nr:hypothetical protein [Candidatus Acetothermia bacterium]MBI3642797.1 hypothetical protein [Candidatus Acetothermia bacterium]